MSRAGIPALNLFFLKEFDQTARDSISKADGSYDCHGNKQVFVTVPLGPLS